MAKFDYARMQATASRLMERFAQGTVTLTRPGGETSGENPWDPPVIVEEQTFTLDATVKGVSEEFIDGTTILATDLEVTAAVFGIEPGAGDEMAIDGKAVTIIKTMKVPAAGTVVAWKFVVRG